MKNLFSAIYFWLGAVCLSSCAAAISERHYFASVALSENGESSEILNVFRIDVDAQGGFTNLRYVAGEYDERAVDFFFNEVRSEDYTPSTNGAAGLTKIFRAQCDDTKTIKQCRDEYGADLKLFELPTDGNRSAKALRNFVMILSSDADAVAEAIGSFAENSVALKSVNYLLNKDTFEEAEVISQVAAVQSENRSAQKDVLVTQFEGYDTLGITGTARELALLRSLAVALEPDKSIPFNSIEEARAWFSAIE